MPAGSTTTSGPAADAAGRPANDRNRLANTANDNAAAPQASFSASHSVIEPARKPACGKSSSIAAEPLEKNVGSADEGAVT